MGRGLSRHQPILRTSIRGINDFRSWREILPGNLARQFAAPQAVARLTAASPPSLLIEARANPATVASPEPTAEIVLRRGGRANQTGPFLRSTQTTPSEPSEIAALSAPRRINSCAALTMAR